MNITNYKAQYNWYTSTNTSETISSVLSRTLIGTQTVSNNTVNSSLSKLKIGNDAILDNGYIYVLCIISKSGFETAYALLRTKTTIDKSIVSVESVICNNEVPTVGSQLEFMVVIDNTSGWFDDKSQIIS